MARTPIKDEVNQYNYKFKLLDLQYYYLMMANFFGFSCVNLVELIKQHNILALILFLIGIVVTGIFFVLAKRTQKGITGFIDDMIQKDRKW